MKVRHRITLWVAGAGLVTSLVFSLVVFLKMRQQPLRMLDAQLKAAAAATAEQLARVQRPAAGRQVILVSTAHYWIRVYGSGPRPVYRSDLSEIVNLPLYRDRGDSPYTVSTHIPKRRIYLHQDDDDEVTFRVRVFRETIAGKRFLVQIARPVEALEESGFSLLGAIGIGLAVSTLLLVCLAYLLAGRIVGAIAEINRLARDINENTLDKRIPLGESRDEVHELGACLNQMFDRLQFSFTRQKQFLADASHELKSPLAMLRLFFEEVQERLDLPENMRRRLDGLGNNVLRMDRLVRRLLELSALEIKGTLAMAPFDIADMARSLSEDFAPLLERESIGLETEFPGRLTLRGDQDMIRRALINLFDNAVKYTGKEGRVSFSVKEKSGRAHLALSNTGPGISGEDLPRVFDQFFRADKSRSAKSGGAGLGLAIVKQIVRLHHGTVSIDSSPGSWTRVDILLPLCAGDFQTYHRN
ncbi:MAG: sensor histidine kinase [Syntrophobacteraceae bacterium]